MRKKAYGSDISVSRHPRWPEAKVRVALHYAEAFPKEIDEALAENDTEDFETLKRKLRQAAEFASGKLLQT